jgi:hypothetical protein
MCTYVRLCVSAQQTKWPLEAEEREATANPQRVYEGKRKKGKGNSKRQDTSKWMTGKKKKL